MLFENEVLGGRAGVVGVVGRLGLTGIGFQAVGEAAEVAGGSWILEVLHVAGDLRVLPAQVLGPVVVVGGRGRRHVVAPGRRVGDVAVLVVVDLVSLARPVDAVDLVQRGLEPSQVCDGGEVRVRRAVGDGRPVVGFGMVAYPAGLKQAGFWVRNFLEPAALVGQPMLLAASPRSSRSSEFTQYSVRMNSSGLVCP